VPADGWVTPNIKSFQAAGPNRSAALFWNGSSFGGTTTLGCPLGHCRNIRPAFIAMRDMGFTHLCVLILLNDFNTDWIEKNYPVEMAK
jgi:hypothetical protein